MTIRSRYDRLVLRRIALRAVSSFRRNIMSAEARCQANRGINAAVFRKQKKYCDSFRFLQLFCVHFCWDGSGFMASGSSVQARMSASTFSFSMYLFASAIIFSLSLGITMPFSKLGYISFPNRDIIFSLSPLQVTSSGGEVHLPYPEYPSSL